MTSDEQIAMLPRYGIEYVSPTEPHCKPMDDGYWTPWHLANEQIAMLREALVHARPWVEDRGQPALLEPIDQALAATAQPEQDGGWQSMESGNRVLMHVWVHTDHRTGEPRSVDVLEVCGRMHMAWLEQAINERNGPELAAQFLSKHRCPNDSAWFVVEASLERDERGVADHEARVIGKAIAQPTRTEAEGEG